MPQNPKDGSSCKKEHMDNSMFMGPSKLFGSPQDATDKASSDASKESFDDCSAQMRNGQISSMERVNKFALHAKNE